MAKLSTIQRKQLPTSSFAGPKGTYPDNDLTHARLALSGASHAEHVGNISASQKATIDAKVHKTFPQIGSKRKRKVIDDAIRGMRK